MYKQLAGMVQQIKIITDFFKAVGNYLLFNFTGKNNNIYKDLSTKRENGKKLQNLRHGHNSIVLLQSISIRYYSSF